MEEQEEKNEKKPKLEDLPKENKHQYENYYQHRGHAMKVAIVVVGGIIIISGAFLVGSATSMHRLGDRRVEKIGINREMPAFNGGFRGKMMGGRGMEVGSNIIGDVTKIDSNNLTVKVGSTEYTVVVSTSTAFIKADQIAKQSDLKVGDQVTVAGQPDSNGQINANAIRITQ